MARITKFVDDLDGSDTSVQTRHFSLGNVRYQIDLSDTNYSAMLQAVQPYVAAATVVSGASSLQRGKPGKVGPVYGDGPAIKAFATSIGAPVPVSRPTNELVRRWIAAHPEEAATWEQRTGRNAIEHYR